MSLVKLSFTVTGDFEDLEVFANDQRLTVTNGKGKLSSEISTTILTLEFEISGDNGTDYSIDYACTSGGIKAEDGNKPSPVAGTIRRGGFKREILKIKL